MPKPMNCMVCGAAYDPDTFLVRMKSNGATYRSWLCRECARKDPNVSEIVETPLEASKK